MLCLWNSTVVDPRFQTRREISDLFITNMYIFTPQDFSLYICLSLFFSLSSLSSLIFFRFLSCNSHFIFFLSLFPYSSPVFSVFHTHSLFSLHCFCFLIYFSLSSVISLFPHLFLSSFFFVYISFNSIYFVSLYFSFFFVPFSYFLFYFSFFFFSFLFHFVLLAFFFLFFYFVFLVFIFIFFYFLFCFFYFLLLSFFFFLYFLFSFTLLFFLTFDCFLSIYLSPSFHFLTTWTIWLHEI